MIAIVFYLACAGLLLALALAGPIFVGLVTGDLSQIQRLLVYLALGAFLCGGILLALLGRLKRVPAIDGLRLVCLVWGVLPLLVAFPVADLAGLSYVDAVFETVSGLTTTGATIVVSIDDLPQPVIFLRSQLNWLGGYFVLLTILLVLSPMAIGGLPAFRLFASANPTALSGRERLWRLSLNVAVFYVVVTAVCFLLLMLTGMRPFFAANLAMTTVSSGGFLPFEAPLVDIAGLPGLLIMTFFLMVAATSVFWHRMILGLELHRLFAHRESYFVIGMAFLLALVVLSTLVDVSADQSSSGFYSLVAESAFNAASLVSTSGVESRQGLLSLLPATLVIFVILIGGSAYSTSGGLKPYRVGGMIVQSTRELDKLVYPNSVRPPRFGSQVYSMTMMKAIWSFFFVAILTIAAGTIAVSFSSVSFDAAFIATVSAFSGAGPVYASGWAEPGAEIWPSWEGFSATGKLSLAVVMILGRVEVLAVLGVFSPKYFSSR